MVTLKDKQFKPYISSQKILEAVKKVIVANPKGVADARTKGEKSFGFLVGQTMKELKGKGNPQKINEFLKKELEK